MRESSQISLRVKYFWLALPGADVMQCKSPPPAQLGEVADEAVRPSLREGAERASKPEASLRPPPNKVWER